MATPLQLADRVQLTVICNTGGQYSANVINYEVTAINGGGISDTDALAVLEPAVASFWGALLSDNAFYMATKLQITFPILRPHRYNNTSATPGSVAGDVLPSQVAGLIKLTTNRAGKSYRGRCYIPFPSEADNTAAGNPSAGYKTNLQALADTFFDVLSPNDGAGNGVDLLPIIYSRELDVSTPVEERLAETNWATQRRRAARNTGDRPPS